MKHVEMKIEGMKCEGCVNRIKNALSKVKGIQNCDISLENKTIKLDIKNDKVLQEVITKIENLDFTVSK